MKETNLTITNLTKGALPRGVPFLKAKNIVLGKKYSLSLVFIGSVLSKKLNRNWRGKEKPANILSFPLSKNEGEIFIDSELAKKECARSNRSLKNQITFLLIHGLYHLKGFKHSSKMERLEEKLRKQFGV